jgi:orotate phosphoribosyltransferase
MKDNAIIQTLSAPVKNLIVEVLQSGSVVIRDVDNGEDPFLYSSGNYGPGYISIKNLVGRRLLMKKLCCALAHKIDKEIANIDFIAANVTGGVIPGWEVAGYLETLLKKNIQYFYVRETRKLGGLKELTTGTFNTPAIQPGMTGIVLEELVNYAETTTNSAVYLREQKGYIINNAGCILFYGHGESLKKLEENGIEMISLFTLPQLLDVAEEYECFDFKRINSFRDFLKDPSVWQKMRDLVPKATGGTK